MAYLTKRNKLSKNDQKVTMKFDIPMLNMLIKYLMSKLLNKSDINNIYTLFNKVDMDAYSYNQDIFDRITFIKHFTDAQINYNIKDLELIRSFISSKDGEMIELCNTVEWNNDLLNKSEYNYISDNISERLQFIYIFEVKDIIEDKFKKIDKADFISYYEIVSELKRDLSQLLVKLQASSLNNGLLKRFSFADESFGELMDLIVQKRKRPTSIVQTGIRHLNAILSPGFQSGRLYTILGLTGKFKSGFLLNIADQIRLFNPQINAVENDCRKTIVFVTLENSIEETIERLFDMYSPIDVEIKDLSTEEVISILRDKGKYVFTDTTGIDIVFYYYSNLEISTADLYSIIQDLEDNNRKVLGLILDYMLQLESIHQNNGDERIRLMYVAKELKALAQYFEIFVLTAMQVNREGNAIIDSAMREDKQDLLNYIGAANIGKCWDIVQESDWMALISIERKISTGQLYLSCKRLKIRGKKDNTVHDYFNHPFTNEKEIRLATDVDKPESLSVISLASELETVNVDELDTRAQVRPKMNDNKKQKEYKDANKTLYAIDTSSLMDNLKKVAV